MSAIRLAVVGGGHLGRIHAKLASGNEQFEVVGVVDPSSESRALVTEQLNLPTYESYEQLIGQADAVVVASPTSAHYEITAELLRSGMHCLVEKPLATTADQAHRLVQIANRYDKVLQVGHVERFNPTWTAAQDHMGAPKYIEATRAGPYSGRSTDIGVVMDLMIHDLDLVLSLDHSRVVSVQASGIAVLGSHEDIAEARIEFESGCIANLKVSRVAEGPTRRMQVYSAGGFAVIDFSAEEVRVVTPTAAVLSRAVALDELPATERMEAKSKVYEDFLQAKSVPAPKRNAILDEQNDFALSIRSGGVPVVSGADGARAVEVACEVVESVNQHAWDGAQSKRWRIGAMATENPTILTMPVPADPIPQRKAG